MKVQGRCFPYEKSIVINALYDTIEALGLCLDSSNSARGTLIVSDPKHGGRMRIALNAAGNTTEVDVFAPDSCKDVCDKWSAIILDELLGTIQRARRTERKNHSTGGDENA